MGVKTPLMRESHMTMSRGTGQLMSICGDEANEFFADTDKRTVLLEPGIKPAAPDRPAL